METGDLYHLFSLFLGYSHSAAAGLLFTLLQQNNTCLLPLFLTAAPPTKWSVPS
jgi:hypothetical protein